MSTSFDINNNYFLNDKCIASSFTDDTGILSVMKIPSLKLVRDTTNTISGHIEEIYSRIKGGINYKGVTQTIDLSTDAYQYKTKHLSNLFVADQEWNALVKAYTELEGEWTAPRAYTADTVLSNGYMFYVSKSRGTETTRWTIDGIELEVGDYIIIHNRDEETSKEGTDGVKVCEITSADIDVIDAIEKDKIIVKNIEVSHVAHLNQVRTNEINSTQISSSELTSDNVYSQGLTSDYAYVKNARIDDMTASGTISVEDIGVNDLSAYRAYIRTLKSEWLSSNGIDVPFSSLKFDSLSSASQICSHIQEQICQTNETLCNTILSVGQISSKINELCSAISTDIIKKYNFLSGEISSNNNDISHISSTVAINISSITDLSDAIYNDTDKFGNKGLSGKVEWLLSSGFNSMEYSGELLSIDYTKHEGSITCFIAQGDDKRATEFFKTGRMFRINCDTPELKDSNDQKIQLKVNDYIFTKKESLLSDIVISNLALIRDAQVETEALQRWVDSNFMHLSGGDFVQNIEYFNEISSSIIKADNLELCSVIIDELKTNEISAAELRSSNADIRNLSVNGLEIFKKISDDIDNKVETVSVDTVLLNGGNVLSSLGQKDGIIEFGTRELVSSDIKYLKEYVENQINLSIENLDSEHGEAGKFILSVQQTNGKITSSVTSKVTDDFIDNESISQYKISGLSSDLANISSDLSTVIFKNKNDMSYFGKVSPFDHKDLSNFIEGTCLGKCGRKFGLGFSFLMDGDSTTQPFVKNDFIIFNKSLEDWRSVKLSDIDVIHDFSHEIISVNNRIDGLDVEMISAENGYILDSVWETDGKISATTRKLVSSDISYLNDYVQTEINLSVKNISSNITIPIGKTITSITQEYGVVSILTSDIVSSDVIGLSDYVKNEIEKLDVSQISETNKFISKVWETDGKISAETRSITDNDISDGLISQTKINSLTSDLKNISSELSGSYSEISTLSTNLGDLSSDYYDLKSNTFYEFDKETHPHISSMGLIITDEKHPEGEGAHDRYVLTFLSGTLVLEKI